MAFELAPSQLFGLTEAALKGGERLLSGWLGARGRSSLRTFPLARPGGPLLEMTGFCTPASGEARSVMGCFQRCRLDRIFMGPHPVRVEEFPLHFSSLCQWERSDGARGGFSYTPLAQKRIGVSTPECLSGRNPVDFSLNGLEWLVARVDIHDFVRAIRFLSPFAGPLSRVVREAAVVVVHRSFGVVASAESEREACSFGYAFLPVAPEPSPFGFGPGHFGAAVKQFRFAPTADGGFEVSLLFLVSPRSEKVLDLGGFDPVYTTCELLDRLLFRKLGLSRRAHDRLDASMLRLHGRVHHRLLVELARRRGPTNDA